MSKYMLKNQTGIAHLPLVIAIVAVGIIAATGIRVHGVQQERKEAARQTAQAQETKTTDPKSNNLAHEKNKEVAAEKPDKQDKKVADQQKPPKQKTEVKTKPKDKKHQDKKKNEKKVTISSTKATVGAESIVLTANLPGNYSGTCKALVKLHDGSKSRWHEGSFNAAKSCSLTVPRSSLVGDGSNWQFYMYFYAGNVHGASGRNTFSL